MGGTGVHGNQRLVSRKQRWQQVETGSGRQIVTVLPHRSRQAANEVAHHSCFARGAVDGDGVDMILGDQPRHERGPLVPRQRLEVRAGAQAPCGCPLTSHLDSNDPLAELAEKPRGLSPTIRRNL